MLKQGKRARSLPAEEEAVAETMCNELTATPTPPPTAVLEGEEVKNSGVKLSPGGRGGGVFKIWFYFSLSYSELIVDKPNFFPK